MKISTENAVQIPTHDATILDLVFPSTKDGFNTVSLKIKLHRDENVQVLKQFGIVNREVWLVWKNCWQINVKLIGYCSGNELVSTFDIVESSPLVHELKTFGFIKSDLLHFRLQGSHGSQLDILTDSIFVEEHI